MRNKVDMMLGKTVRLQQENESLVEQNYELRAEKYGMEEDKNNIRYYEKENKSKNIFIDISVNSAQLSTERQ